jgi:hypothetical protein
MKLWVDRELKRKLQKARAHDPKIFDCTGLDPERVKRVLELAEQVGVQEQERETNLNARGAAVATVAGLIVTVSGAVTNSLFPTPGWTDWTKLATLGLFVAALFLVTSSMFMAVAGVLRPGRGARTKNHLGETLMGLWLYEDDALLKANRDSVDLLCLDRALRTIPEWHIRNRQKARWLRRSWMFLLGGVLLIALAAVFLLVHLLDVQGSAGPNGPATMVTGWDMGGFLLGVALLAWLALVGDLVIADRREESPADKQALAAGRQAEQHAPDDQERDQIEEIKKIAAALRT